MTPQIAVLNGVEQWPTQETRLGCLDVVARGLGCRKFGIPLVILEVGSLFGVSARVLAKYGHVTCVDAWQYEGGLEGFHAATEGLSVQAVRGRSDEVLPRFPSASFDIIYVDGDHCWPVVDRDLAQAKRLVRPDGIICGDDLERVINYEDEAQRMEPLRHVDYIREENYHPGVSLAVYRAFGTGVRMQDGFWWVQA